MAQSDTVVNLVDKAAQASDRWLFLFILAILLGGGFLTIRYLVTALDKQQTSHNEFTTKIFAENIKLTAQLVVALQENNMLLDRIKLLLEKQSNK